jgi:hypothetical protein
MLITIKKEIDLDKEFFESVFITALEGGSNYWYFLNEEAVDKVRKAVPKSKQGPFALALLEAVAYHGVDVDVSDADDETTVLGTISIKTMQDRLQSMSDGIYASALNRQMNELGDALDADCIFQYIVMGDVVFG